MPVIKAGGGVALSFGAALGRQEEKGKTRKRKEKLKRKRRIGKKQKRKSPRGCQKKSSNPWPEGFRYGRGQDVPKQENRKKRLGAKRSAYRIFATREGDGKKTP